jgi:hypothetical protein
MSFKERAHEHEHKLRWPSHRHIEPSEQQRLAACGNSLARARESELVARGACGGSDTGICASVWIRQYDGLTARGIGQGSPSVDERMCKRRVVERRQGVMPQRVKADLDARVGKLADVAGAKTGVLGICPESLPESRGDSLALPWSHLFDVASELGERWLRLAAAASENNLRRQVQSPFGSRFKSLPPEPVWAGERGAGQEEGGRDVELPQQREGCRDVGAQVVVEGEGHREALAPPPLANHFEEPGRGNDLVMPAEMSQLRGEITGRDGGYQACLRGTIRLSHLVVDEREAHPAPRETQDRGDNGSEQMSKEPIDER